MCEISEIYFNIESVLWHIAAEKHLIASFTFLILKAISQSVVFAHQPFLTNYKINGSNIKQKAKKMRWRSWELYKTTTKMTWENVHEFAFSWISPTWQFYAFSDCTRILCCLADLQHAHCVIVASSNWIKQTKWKLESRSDRHEVDIRFVELK